MVVLAEDWGNPQMRVEFDGGTLLLREASEDIPYAEWDDRVEEFRAARLSVSQRARVGRRME